MTDSDNQVALGEFDVIATYFRPLTQDRDEALGLTDDAGLLTPPTGSQLVVTTDALVAGRHFLADMDPASLGHKVLGVNLSDLAAMGATPQAYTLALAAPKPLSGEWLAAFTVGLGEAQAAGNVFLLGGDTVGTTGPLTLSITALGWVADGRALCRSGAAPGHDLYVSGTVGDAALGLLIARDDADLTGNAEMNRYLKDRFERPQPRVFLGPALVGCAHSCVDISDGLVADIGHIAETSGVGAQINAQDLPLSDAAQTALDQAPDLLEGILTGGDDYELAFTAPVSARNEITVAAKSSAVPVTRIGSMIERPGVHVIGPGGVSLDLSIDGFRHF